MLRHFLSVLPRVPMLGVEYLQTVWTRNPRATVPALTLRIKRKLHCKLTLTQPLPATGTVSRHDSLKRLSVETLRTHRGAPWARAEAPHRHRTLPNKWKLCSSTLQAWASAKNWQWCWKSRGDKWSTSSLLSTKSSLWTPAKAFKLTKWY